MNFYRMSIAWTRIMPNGDVPINKEGIDFYSKVINKIIELKMEPMITMYHWDLPQYLQNLGGFTNELITKYFKSYADVLFNRFGDRVKHWITFNEPPVFCISGLIIFPYEFGFLNFFLHSVLFEMKFD